MRMYCTSNGYKISPNCHRFGTKLSRSNLLVDSSGSGLSHSISFRFFPINLRWSVCSSAWWWFSFKRISRRIYWWYIENNRTNSIKQFKIATGILFKWIINDWWIMQRWFSNACSTISWVILTHNNKIHNFKCWNEKQLFFFLIRTILVSFLSKFSVESIWIAESLPTNVTAPRMSKAIMSKISIPTTSRITMVHIIAILFSSVIIVVSALLGAQYVCRYRKYQLAESAGESDSPAHTPRTSMGSIVTGQLPSRAVSTATLLSEVVSFVKIRPRGRWMKHSRLRESVDAEALEIALHNGKSHR